MDNNAVIYSQGTALAYTMCSVESEQGRRLIFKDGSIHYMSRVLTRSIIETILIHSTAKVIEAWKF